MSPSASTASSCRTWPIKKRPYGKSAEPSSRTAIFSASSPPWMASIIRRCCSSIAPWTAANRSTPRRKNAAFLNDHALYDFAFGQFRFQGLDQHFWQPFEIGYRFGGTGFALIRKKKVHLSWSQFGGQDSLKQYPPPWDWFFLAKPAV